MLPGWMLLIVMLWCAGGWAAGATPVPAAARQMVLVTSADWSATVGNLQRYERGATGGWRAVGRAWPVALGRSGLGWGSGLAPAGEGPLKREGDGRSPAGVYRLTESYGYSSRPPGGAVFPYRPLVSGDRCVDDAAAADYNRIVTIGEGRPERWGSAEIMRREDELYRWVVFVAHNSNPPRPGGGSCIFLHVWGGPKSPTAGCTAMERSNIEALLGWLKPEAEPVLVQLPEAVYRQVREGWQLP